MHRSTLLCFCFNWPTWRGALIWTISPTGACSFGLHPLHVPSGVRSSSAGGSSWIRTAPPTSTIWPVRCQEGAFPPSKTNAWTTCWRSRCTARRRRRTTRRCASQGPNRKEWRLDHATEAQYRRCLALLFRGDVDGLLSGGYLFFFGDPRGSEACQKRPTSDGGTWAILAMAHVYRGHLHEAEHHMELAMRSRPHCRRYVTPQPSPWSLPLSAGIRTCTPRCSPF